MHTVAIFTFAGIMVITFLYLRFRHEEALSAYKKRGGYPTEEELKCFKSGAFLRMADSWWRRAVFCAVLALGASILMGSRHEKYYMIGVGVFGFCSVLSHQRLRFATLAAAPIAMFVRKRLTLRELGEAIGAGPSGTMPVVEFLVEEGYARKLSEVGAGGYPVLEYTGPEIPAQATS